MRRYRLSVEKKNNPTAAMLNVIKLCMEKSFPLEAAGNRAELVYEP